MIRLNKLFSLVLLLQAPIAFGMDFQGESNSLANNTKLKREMLIKKMPSLNNPVKKEMPNKQIVKFQPLKKDMPNKQVVKFRPVKKNVPNKQSVTLNPPVKMKIEDQKIPKFIRDLGDQAYMYYSLTNKSPNTIKVHSKAAKQTSLIDVPSPLELQQMMGKSFYFTKEGVPYSLTITKSEKNPVNASFDILEKMGKNKKFVCAFNVQAIKKAKDQELINNYEREMRNWLNSLPKGKIITNQYQNVNGEEMVNTYEEQEISLEVTPSNNPTSFSLATMETYWEYLTENMAVKCKNPTGMITLAVTLKKEQKK